MYMNNSLDLNLSHNISQNLPCRQLIPFPNFAQHATPSDSLTELNQLRYRSPELLLLMICRGVLLLLRDPQNSPSIQISDVGHTGQGFASIQRCNAVAKHPSKSSNCRISGLNLN